MAVLPKAVGTAARQPPPPWLGRMQDPPVICPVHGEVGFGGMDRICNVPSGWGPPSMVMTQLGMAPAGPRLPGRCGLALMENATEAAASADWRRQERDHEDHRVQIQRDLLAAVAAVDSLPDFATLLTTAAQAHPWRLAGWPAALQDAWARLCGQSLFGTAPYDLIECIGTWVGARRDGIVLELDELDRTPAWVAWSGGEQPIKGIDLPGVNKLYTVDVWVTGNGQLYVNADVHGRSRPGSTTGNFSVEFIYGDPATSRPFSLKKGKHATASDLLLAVPRDAAPRIETKKEIRRMVPTGLANGLQLTPLPPSPWDVTRVFESALRALIAQQARTMSEEEDTP